MKDKKRHVFSILLLLAIIILTVSTSRKQPERIRNSINYETRGEYFLIKIRTKNNPNNYGLFGPSLWNMALYLYSENREEMQMFSINESWQYITEYKTKEETPIVYINQSGEYITEMREEIITKQIIIDDEYFSTFIEDKYFIIRIRNDLILYENPRVDSIMLTGKNGEYIHEVYTE